MYCIIDQTLREVRGVSGLVETVVVSRPTHSFRDADNSACEIHAGDFMKRYPKMLLTVVFLTGFLYITTTSAAQDPQQDAKQNAQKVADVWLSLTDSGKYTESWDQSADAFKSTITKEKWQDLLEKSRTPLGKINERKVKSAEYQKSPQGAPAGEFVRIKYDTSFANKASAIE